MPQCLAIHTEASGHHWAAFLFAGSFPLGFLLLMCLFVFLMLQLHFSSASHCISSVFPYCSRCCCPCHCSSCCRCCCRCRCSCYCCCYLLVQQSCISIVVSKVASLGKFRLPEFLLRPLEVVSWSSGDAHCLAPCH